MASLYSTQWTRTIQPTNRPAEGLYWQGNVICLQDTYVVTAAAAASDTIDFFRIPDKCVVLDGLLTCTDGTASNTLKIGIFGEDGATTYNGTTSNDDDFFCTALSIADPAVHVIGRYPYASQGVRITRQAIVRGTLSAHDPLEGQIIHVMLYVAVE